MLAQARVTLLVQILLVALVTVAVTTTAASSVVDSTEEDVQGATSSPSDSNLQVLPSTGSPAPLDSPLQSAPNSTDQQTTGDLQQQSGGLQTPDSNQQLQPNARTDSLPDDAEL